MADFGGHEMEYLRIVIDAIISSDDREVATSYSFYLAVLNS